MILCAGILGSKYLIKYAVGVKPISVQGHAQKVARLYARVPLE